MSDLNIAIVQTEQYWEDKSSNLQHFQQLLKKVDADLVLLPEMFQTGFSMNTSLAEDFETSDSIQWLKSQAKQLDAAMYTSMMVRVGEDVFNRGVFVYPNGELAHYDKMKCFGMAGEDKYITAGQKRKIVKYRGWNIQLNVCYDLRFPEILRNQMTSSNHSPLYDVNLFVANWPARRIAHWRSLLQARAIENQAVVIGANRVGTDKNEIIYDGQSMIVDAKGAVVLDAKSEDTVLTFNINKQELEAARKSLPFLRDSNVSV